MSEQRSDYRPSGAQHSRTSAEVGSENSVRPYRMADNRRAVSAPAVAGQRSPRWAFMKRMTIPCENGLVYLVRLRIVQTPWFAVYLHDIHEPDGDRDPHDHPWSFISIVLRGSYTETLHTAPWVHLDAQQEQTWRRWSWHRMGRETAHRITRAAPGLETLILVGPRRRNWGFFTPDGFVEWQDYEALKETSGRSPAPLTGGSALTKDLSIAENDHEGSS